MRIALAQLDSVQGDFQGAVRAMLAASRRAAGLDADLVVFPETVLTGAYPVGPSVSDSYQMALLDAVEEFAARTEVPSLVPAFINDGTYTYYEAFLCDRGKAGPLRLTRARRVADDDLAPDQAPARVLLGDVTVRLWMGGEDLLPDDPPDDVVVMCSTRPFSGDDPYAQPAMRAGIVAMGGLADDFPGWLAGVCGVGGYDEVVFAGGSFAIDPDGTVAAHAAAFEEDMVTFDVEPVVPQCDEDEGPVAYSPVRVSVCEDADGRGAPGGRGDRDRRGGPARLAGPACPVDPDCPEAPSRTGGPTRRPGRRGDSALAGMSLEEIDGSTSSLETDEFVRRALELALRDRVLGAGKTDVALHLDAGACSAAVLALAVRALGADHVHALVATGAGLDEDDADAAMRRAGGLGVEATRADVAGAALALGTGPDGRFPAARLREAAALRGVLLARLSDQAGALPLSCMSKTHAALGIPSTCEAPAGAYAPLADVFAPDARSMVGSMASAGLTDPALIEADELPDPALADPALRDVPRDAVWRALRMHLGGADGPADGGDIVRRGGDRREWVDAVLRCAARAEAGRRQDPLGPVVSGSALVDRGMPVVLGWNDPVESHAYRSTDISRQLARLLGVDEESMRGSLGEAGDGPVAGRLDDMVGATSRQDQVLGAVGDVVFGLSVGRLPNTEEPEGILGLSLFSRN